MQSFLSIDDLESASQETLRLMDTRQEIQQRLEQYCVRLEELKRGFDQKGILEGDAQAKATYEQLTTAIRHYRSQIQQDLPELSRRLIEARESLAQNGESSTEIDVIKQVIEERREEQAQREYEAQMSKHQAERLAQERHETAEQLLDRIKEQTSYYDASYLAMDVYHYREDLKGVDRLDEVVEFLYNRVQELSEKPITIQGTAIQKLKIMDAHARKLWSQSQPDPRPIGEKRTKPDAPVDEKEEKESYTHLRGKVVVFGGHTTTRTYVKEKLPKVYFVWSTVEDGLLIVDQAVQQIQTADVVLLLTDDTSHAVTRKAMTELRRLKKQPIELHHEGVNTIVEKIAWKLMFKSC
ncbi:hypothetical protein [Leptolyngbya sp. NIES-2104]|uniref:hypothetical protein n=1 Tax=Leptolyngbya sp. NIES-2104 TaxID=1552121 RepID=UPI0006ECC88C|nr:hypothetical protein [Leptolyngbya sp. NIES-2104]GAP96048.1 hypothetical protein NIES2104_25770 [Leptolyngbya sp. NIES-2104]